MSYEQYQNWILLHSAKSPTRTAIALAPPMGVAFGTFMGLQYGSVAIGVFEGIFFGVFMGLALAILYRRMSKRSFQDVDSPDQRFEVIKTVQRGEQIKDPALAPAVVKYSHEVVRQWEGRLAKFGRLIVLIGPVLSAAFLINALAHGNAVQAIIWILIGASYVFMVIRWPKMWRKNIEHARLAERLAQPLISGSPER